MLRTRHELSRVSYNAAEQAFEALVTFHTSDGRESYAASVEAPLDLSFEDATELLIADARAQARKGCTLSSRLRPRRHKATGLIEALTGRRLPRFSGSRAA